MIDWQTGGATTLIALGLVRVIWAVRRDTPEIRLPVSNSNKGRGLVRCFRSVIIGTAMIAVGIGWLWKLPELLGLALIIGVGETVETTIVLGALNAQVKPYRRYAPRVQRPRWT